jgi:energy-coupling factor transporter ATP-binding protein EcfA2
VGLLSAIGTAVILIYGGYSALDLAGDARAEQIGVVVAFVGYLNTFFDPIQQLSNLYTTYQQGMAALDKIFDLLDTEPDMIDKPDAFDPGTLRGEIEMDHVWFSYGLDRTAGLKRSSGKIERGPDEEEDNAVWALEDVSIHVPAGQTLALVGETGAGKSTAITLLLCRRPAEQHWAVLVNDFGSCDIHSVHSTSPEHLTFREVAGCICCTAQVAVRTALVKMLRGFAPQRLLIEASSAAEPIALVHLLHESGIANALELRSTLCVVNTKQLGDKRYLANAVYREQIRSADAIYISNNGAMTAVERASARNQLEALRSEPVVAFFDESEPFDVELLDMATRA